MDTGRVRVCCKCKVEKPIFEFYKYKDDYHYDCKDCYKINRSKSGHLFRGYVKKKTAVLSQIDNLSNCYVKGQLKKAGFEMIDINPLMIELKKQQIILNRTIRCITSKM